MDCRGKVEVEAYKATTFDFAFDYLGQPSPPILVFEST